MNVTVFTDHTNVFACFSHFTVFDFILKICFSGAFFNVGQLRHRRLNSLLPNVFNAKNYQISQNIACQCNVFSLTWLPDTNPVQTKGGFRQQSEFSPCIICTNLTTRPKPPMYQLYVSCKATVNSTRYVNCVYGSIYMWLFSSTSDSTADPRS